MQFRSIPDINIVCLLVVFAFMVFASYHGTLFLLLIFISIISPRRGALWDEYKKVACTLEWGATNRVMPSCIVYLLVVMIHCWYRVHWEEWKVPKKSVGSGTRRVQSESCRHGHRAPRGASTLLPKPIFANSSSSSLSMKAPQLIILKRTQHQCYQQM